MSNSVLPWQRRVAAVTEPEEPEKPINATEDDSEEEQEEDASTTPAPGSLSKKTVTRTTYYFK